MRKEIPVKEIMTRDVVTVSPKDTIAKAAKIMSSRRVGCVVVVQDGEPIGIVTERDILTKVVGLDLKPSKVLVGEIMSAPIVSISADADVLEAARLMRKHDIRRLPVVNEGKLVGIVTTSDLASVMTEVVELESLETSGREEMGTSVCERCGQFSNYLYEVDGKWVCENCKEEE